MQVLNRHTNRTPDWQPDTKEAPTEIFPSEGKSRTRANQTQGSRPRPPRRGRIDHTAALYRQAARETHTPEPADLPRRQPPIHGFVLAGAPQIADLRRLRRSAETASAVSADPRAWAVTTRWQSPSLGACRASSASTMGSALMLAFSCPKGNLVWKARFCWLRANATSTCGASMRNGIAAKLRKRT